MHIKPLLSVVMLGSAVCLMSACTGTEVTKDAEVPAHTDVVNATEVADTECRNGGDRLALSGMCEDAAIASLNLVGGEAPALPDGCGWEIQETQFAVEVLMYMAASCDGKTSKLGYSGGAQQAHLFVEASAFADVTETSSEEPYPIVRVMSADMDQLHANVENQTRAAIDSAEEAANCSVRPADMEGWPADALVVDVQNPIASEDGPRSACGMYGYTEESTQYWRVFDGFSWFFELGQDAYQDIDPASLTLIMVPAE